VKTLERGIVIALDLTLILLLLTTASYDILSKFPVYEGQIRFIRMKREIAEAYRRVVKGDNYVVLALSLLPNEEFYILGTGHVLLIRITYCEEESVYLANWILPVPIKPILYRAVFDEETRILVHFIPRESYIEVKVRRV